LSQRTSRRGVVKEISKFEMFLYSENASALRRMAQGRAWGAHSLHQSKRYWGRLIRNSKEMAVEGGDDV
jgi:hypothetical protein